MSPSEDELRAALHHGEGDGVDVDRVLQHAAAERHQRRVRILAVAAAVVAVAGIGIGGTVLISDQHSGHRSALGTPPGRDALRLGPSSPPQPLSTQQSVSSTAPASSTACPARLPQVDSPQSVPSAASRQSLFAAPVASLVVCAYFADQLPVAQNGVPVSTSFTGSAAAAIAASLDAADTQRQQGVECPTMIPLSARTLVFFATGSDGAPLPPVVAPIDRPAGCNAELTNGTAARFNWIPPTGLSDYLALLRTISPLPRGGMNSGSPAH